MVPTFSCGLVRSNFSFATINYLFVQFGWTGLTTLLFDDLLSDVGRCLAVLGELHGEGRTPLRQRSQLRSVAEHFSQRNLRVEHLRTTRNIVHALHDT